MNRLIGWLFLTGALTWGAQAAGRFWVDEPTTWHAWANLFTAVAFALAGVAYLRRPRQERSHGASSKDHPDEPTS